MAEDKLNLLRRMREIVRTRQKTDSQHPHSAGVSLLVQQKFADAVEKFREAVALDPQFSFSHHYLGSALLEIGKIDHAKKSLLQAAELNPHYAATFLYLGKIEAENENWREAERYYRKTLDLRPDFIEAKFGLTAVLFEIGQTENEEIIELLRKIIESDYTNDTILAQLVSLHPIETDFYLNLADDLLQNGQIQKAILLYRLAILADSELPLPKLKLATLLFGLGKNQEAEVYLHKSANLPSQNAESLRLTGDLFFRQSSFSVAISAYWEVLELKPDEAEIYKKIGDSLARQNQFEEAKNAYRQAIKLGYNY